MLNISIKHNRDGSPYMDVGLESLQVYDDIQPLEPRWNEDGPTQELCGYCQEEYIDFETECCSLCRESLKLLDGEINP